VLSFINRCLRYICRIWWPRAIFNERLWKETNQVNVNIEKKVAKIQVDWPHIKKERDREPSKAALIWKHTSLQKERKAKERLWRSTVAEAGKGSWRELRCIARDRRKCKDLVNNLYTWWSDGLYYYY
jgi:hypothetical protein